MKKIETKETTHYTTPPYTICLKKDEDGDYVATVKELEGCMAHGATEAEALVNLKEVQDAWIEMRLEAGLPIPEPDDEDSLPSGKWIQRVPRSLHRKLIQTAKNEGVSLNAFCSSLLAEGVGRKAMTTSTQELVSYFKAISARNQQRSICDRYKQSFQPRWSEPGAIVGSSADSAALQRVVQLMISDSNPNEIHFDKYHATQKELSTRAPQ